MPASEAQQRSTTDANGGDQMSADGLIDLVRRHKAGEPVGVTSVCSAHPLVIEAALRQALEDDTVALIEATSNQVDQFGGYTGMVPAEFRDLVLATGRRIGVPEERVVLGGDHLGPNTWRTLPADEAMTRAAGLVRAYVEAGYAKLHLDCSMPCADDSGRLDEDVVARRTAELAAVAERTANEQFGNSELLYVIGSEVPIPGGARETLAAVTPTSAEAARTTLAAHQQEFARRQLEAAWERVVALVVQPGVEFDAWHIVDYDRGGTSELRRVPDQFPRLVFEAHSTDYQNVGRLEELVRDHWAVLKVGPALTFALREALFALAGIEDEIVPTERRSHLVETVERVMVSQPKWWQTHYAGDADEQRLARRYSYSDRLRYYWATPEVMAAHERLVQNLRQSLIPLPLISAVLPRQYGRIRTGRLEREPIAIAVDRVRDVLRGYAAACSAQPDKRM
jgi:D-tagatose-1,6-bisphosphate aldolase subunit GatZ/KbaZ